MSKPNKWLIGILMLMAICCCGGIFAYSSLFGGSQIEHGRVSIEADPTGKQILFTSAAGGLYTFDLTSKTVVKLSVPQGGAFAASYSPDGKRVVYATPSTDTAESIEIMDLDSKSTTRITSDLTVSDGDPRFSPDGKSVAFVRAHRYRDYSMGGKVWDDIDLYIVELASKKTVRLTNETYRGAGSLSFVDQGKSIAFSYSSGEVGETTGVSKISLEPISNPQVVFSANQPGYRGGAFASDIRFSPDGHAMTFISDRATSYEYDVYVADENGNNLNALGLTKIASYNQNPIFASDGKSVFVLTGKEKNLGSRAIYSLYQINLSGNMTEIADSGLFTDPDHWKPK